jgi:hypothetical protein
MAFLTDRTLATGVTPNDLIHIVVTGDTSQNPAGSSFKATMGQVLDLINPTTITGGTYNPITGDITFTNSSGGTFVVTGLVTGYTNTAVTAFTYNNSNSFTIFENDGSTYSASINVVTGMTFNGFLQSTGSTASGLNSFAFGNNVTSIGDYSFSYGRDTISSGISSHSEGRGTVSIGNFSHAEGTYTESRGGYSHSEGEVTISIGAGSHSEGEFTISVGQCSHAEGSGTTTYGNYSHSEGLGTITNGDYQHTQGQFNFTSSTQSAFIIGNGTSDSNRSNLVFAAGNDFNIYGNLNVTGTIFSTGSTQFISTTGITISAVTLSTGTTYNGINYAGNVDLTIPSPSGFTGLKIIVKDESGNAGTYRIRLTPSVGTIDGSPYVDMNINYMSLTLVARNNNWWII